MQRTLLAVATALCVSTWASAGAAPQSDRRAQPRVEEALRREGEALAALADAALAGRPAPGGFTLSWRNDFFKAQPGTFVPFTVTFTAPVLQSKTALMYVRAQRHPPRRGATPGPQYAYETIFPVKVDAVAGQPVSVTRGFAVPPGRYRIAIVLREAAEDVRQGERTRQTATLVKDLEVPDFWTGELAASTVILADRVETLKEPVPADELDEHPYVVGPSRIHPASGAVFSRSRELIVVFLVYNPSIGADNHFDVQVDYHVYRKDQGGQEARAGVPAERYVTRTNPQRFNPSLMGPQFDPSAGTPILAGQGILLSEFEPGDYRLGITVTDLLSRKTVSRDVAFTVAGS